MDWSSDDFRDRFQRGDAATLEGVYWRFVEAVEQVLRRGFVTRDRWVNVPGVVDPEQRADLLQEVFLKAFAPQARRSFNPELDYRAYLLAIVRNTLVDHLRRSGRDRMILRAEMDADADIADHEEIDAAVPEWGQPHVADILARYVAGLVSPLRELHQWRFVVGKSQREAAKLMNMSRQNVRTLEERLKDGLRGALAAPPGPHGPPLPADGGRREGVSVSVMGMRTK